jgi:hypothetical protein
VDNNDLFSKRKLKMNVKTENLRIGDIIRMIPKTSLCVLSFSNSIGKVVADNPHEVIINILQGKHEGVKNVSFLKDNWSYVFEFEDNEGWDK